MVFPAVVCVCVFPTSPPTTVVAQTPGLYKIFDEIIVNAADNKQRDPTMTTIKITIDSAEGSVSVWNDGHGVPVVEHAEHGVYVPELIFAHLLTGSNFDDDQKKTTGGRNGCVARTPPSVPFVTARAPPVVIRRGRRVVTRRAPTGSVLSLDLTPRRRVRSTPTPN